MLFQELEDAVSTRNVLRALPPLQGGFLHIHHTQSRHTGSFLGCYERRVFFVYIINSCARSLNNYCACVIAFASFFVLGLVFSSCPSSVLCAALSYVSRNQEHSPGTAHFLSHPIRHIDPRKCVPLSIHGDGLPCMGIGKRGAKLSMSGLGLRYLRKVCAASCLAS